MSGQVLDRDEAPPPAASRTRRPMRRRVLLLAALALTGSAGWQGWRWWQVGRFVESTDDAYVGGEVTALAPKVAGYIVEVAVTDNQAVHAGDLLVRLDDRDYRAALARAEAQVALAQAAIANLGARRDLQDATVSETSAVLGSTEAEVERARMDQDRYRKLSATNVASIQTFQKADADLKKAVAEDRRARAALAAATRQLAVLATERQQAEATLAQAAADRDLARLNLGYTELRAPMDGVVGNRRARVGAYATPGAQLLALVPSHGLWVDANFKESQLARMRPGMAAHISADALPGQVFDGRVGSLAPATGAQFSVIPPENATGNFTKIVQRVPVRILLSGDAGAFGALRPGLSVTADVDTRTTASSSP